MLHIENIDLYSIRFGSYYGGGTYKKVHSKTLRATSTEKVGNDTTGRVWIQNTESKDMVLNCYNPALITLDGTIYTDAENFVVAFNALMASSTAYTTTTTTTPPTTTTTTTV